MNQDIVLNQNTSDEAEIYSHGISINDRQIFIEGNNHTICAKDLDKNQVKLFNIKNSNVTLSNMIITSANFNGAGGVISLDKNSNLILKNITFKDNSAKGIYGEGGVIFSWGNLLVYDSIFENNYATGAGGAINSINSSCFIYSSKFINNSANWYGGAIFSDKDLEVIYSTFDSNHAYGGAAVHYTTSDYSWNFGGYAILYNSSFINNIADFGAATYSSSIFPLSVLNSNFSNNHADKGGVLYRNALSIYDVNNCLFDNNSARIGAVFYDDSVEMYCVNAISFINVSDSIFKNNFASDKASVFYAKTSAIWVNQSVFYNNTKFVLYNGNGNITVLNSKISNNESDFFTQFLGGNLVIVNNTWGVNDYNFSLNCKSDIDLDTFKINAFNSEDIYKFGDIDCCSVYLRLNQSDFTISHRRDGGSDYNMTAFIDRDQNYIREFKTFMSYFLLSKVYTNGWVIGSGGWESSGANEKIEAIASDMVKNENITLEGLEIILNLFKVPGAGHLLIVSPDGNYGNVITHTGNDFIKMGVVGDGDYIISPNGPDYRREGHLDNISDVVFANMNLSANDWYGTFRHGIVIHHINFNESGFSDAINVANDDGRFVNRSDHDLCERYWFKEQFIPDYDVPIIFDKKYLGTFYQLNKTVLSQDASKIYGSDYDYSVQLFTNGGDFLDNVAVNITVNGKTSEYVTNNNGVVTIHFYDLVNSKIISLTNPLSGESVTNIITVLPTLIGDNLVKYFKNESQFAISLIDDEGNPVVDENITFIINGKSYKRLTNDDGRAKLNINLNPGKYCLTAIDPLTGFMISYNITVLPTLIGDNLVKYFRNESQFYVALVDGEGKPVSNKTVTLNINGVFYHRTTNENGTAKLNINLGPGEYILTAIDPFTGLMISYNITVLPVLTAFDINMTYLDGSQFKVNLVDGNGNAFEGQNIIFNINGVLYNRTTDSDGQAKLNIRLMPGEYIITSMYCDAMASNKITIIPKRDFS